MYQLSSYKSQIERGREKTPKTYLRKTIPPWTVIWNEVIHFSALKIFNISNVYIFNTAEFFAFFVWNVVLEFYWFSILIISITLKINKWKEKKNPTVVTLCYIIHSVQYSLYMFPKNS